MQCDSLTIILINDKSIHIPQEMRCDSLSAFQIVGTTESSTLHVRELDSIDTASLGALTL